MDTHSVAKGIGSAHADSAEHLCGIVSDGLAVEDLNNPCHGDNECAALVLAAKAVSIASVLRFQLFHFVGVVHKGKHLAHRLLGVVSWAGQAAQALLSLFNLATANKVPGRLGSEPGHEEERGNPHPLETVGDLPAGVAFNADGASEHACG